MKTTMKPMPKTGPKNPLEPYLNSRRLQNVPRDLWPPQRGRFVAINVLCNDRFIVMEGEPQETEALGTVIHLLVRPHNQRHPGWAALQEIKNEVCGREAWGFEAFPRQSEVVDSANIYHIWVVTDQERVPRLRV